MKNPSSRRFHVTLSVAAAVASLAALAIPGCGSSTCSTSADCSDTEYCPQEEGACLTASLTEHSCAERPVECPKVDAPVCGCDNKTYANACVAALVGVSVASVGTCLQTCDDCGKAEFCVSEPGACGQGTICRARPETCPPVQDAVCGCDGTTYSSECEAQKAGTSVFSLGTCEIPIEERECGGPARVECPEGYTCQLDVGGCLDADPVGLCRPTPTAEQCAGINNPVCGCDGETYQNDCEALLAGVPVGAFDACPCGPTLATCPADTYCQFALGRCTDAAPVGQCTQLSLAADCPELKSEVCGCDGQTYRTACNAAAAGVSVAIERACPCGPTLGECPEGSFCNFPTGACGNPEPSGNCAVVPNQCPDVIVPVCGCDGEDYDSACEAAKRGLSIRVVGPCSPTTGAAAGGG